MTESENNAQWTPAGGKLSEEKAKAKKGLPWAKSKLLLPMALYVLILVLGGLLIGARGCRSGATKPKDPQETAFVVPCGSESGPKYVATRELAANQVIRPEDLQPVIVLLEGVTDLPKRGAAGRYTRLRVAQGTLVTPEDLAILPRFDLADQRETFLVPTKGDSETVKAFPPGSVVHLYREEKVMEKGEILAVVCAPPNEEPGEGTAPCWFVLAIPRGRTAELLAGECKQTPLTLRKDHHE